MDLNIVDRGAISFNEAVGISEERANELSDAMDLIVGKYIGQLAHTCDIFKEIVALCNNTEEVVFCTISHCNWASVRFGIIFCPPKNKK